jgi:hypothetical protein
MFPPLLTFSGPSRSGRVVSPAPLPPPVPTNQAIRTPPKSPLALRNRRFTPSNPGGLISKRTHFPPDSLDLHPGPFAIMLWDSKFLR